jgi:DUF4097 and DUF4098 domain-containing protein YvlB
MPTYTTPAPIDLAVNVLIGAIEVVASDRADTVVTVVPSSEAKAADRRAAKETKVDLVAERLTIVGPRPRISWIGPSESIDVRVELPSGSRLTVELSMGTIRTQGRLSATRIKSSMGSVDLDVTGDVWLRASHGDTRIATAEGNVEINAGYGQTRVGTITGDATFTSSHGAIEIEEIAGDINAKLSYGNLSIDRALGSVTAKTAYGRIEIDEVSAGTIDIQSGYGQLSVAVRQGVSAWLDLWSKDGRVRNHLKGDIPPQESDNTVAVRAHSQAGDVTVQRAR